MAALHLPTGTTTAAVASLGATRQVVSLGPTRQAANQALEARLRWASIPAATQGRGRTPIWDLLA